MRRGGSVSFVVEVKKRRFPQQSATTIDRDRGSTSRVSLLEVGASSWAPLIGTNPTVEAAKIVAKRFFSKPGSSHSVRADGWSDPADGFISRVEPAGAADAAVQKPAADLVASPPAQPAARAEKPRSGRVLQNLLAEDPIDALLRREDEERSRHRPRGPRARSVIPNGAAVPTGSGQIAVHKVPGKLSTTFTESLVSTDIVKPGRKLRGRKIVTDTNPSAGTPRRKTAKKNTARAPGRTSSPRRTTKEVTEAKRQAQKRASTWGFNKKGIAKRVGAKKGKAAVPKNTSVRASGAKGSRGRPALAKNRSAARRTATTLSGRKLATKKIGKTNRSAASTVKTSTRAPKAGKHSARRIR